MEKQLQVWALNGISVYILFNTPNSLTTVVFIKLVGKRVQMITEIRAYINVRTKLGNSLPHFSLFLNKLGKYMGPTHPLK